MNLTPLQHVLAIIAALLTLALILTFAGQFNGAKENPVSCRLNTE